MDADMAPCYQMIRLPPPRELLPYRVEFGSATTGEAIRETTVQLSIRLTPAEAARLAAGARSAGLSQGLYLADLMPVVPVLTTGASRTDHTARWLLPERR